MAMETLSLQLMKMLRLHRPLGSGRARGSLIWQAGTYAVNQILMPPDTNKSCQHDQEVQSDRPL